MTNKNRHSLAKAKTGIDGFDEITGGGLPRGRPTLIVGGPGSGKTLFAMEFLVKGAMLYNEPGVFISFEEPEDDLRKNVASLGFDIKDLEKKGLFVIDHIKVEASEVIETGEYDLEALFVRLGYAIDTIGAKRIAIDTIESIFSSFRNELVLRSELRRLFRFLKERGMTAIITGERGEDSLTRNGLEEYVSDAVIILDNRVINNLATRRLRVLKYRGSSHGSNEYPFIIDENGFSVLPITSVGLTAKANIERISSGIETLDNMFGGIGFYKGSTIMISGGAGSGKTSFAAEFAVEACEHGKKVLFYTFEESPSQITRNMLSIGVDLTKHVKKGDLLIYADRPTVYGLETHLVTFHKLIREFRPQVVVVDPISSLIAVGSGLEVKATMVRLVDYLKMEGITAMFTDLLHSEEGEASTRAMVSSLVDTWLRLENVEMAGENRRFLKIIKSRGMPHSSQTIEYIITDDGIKLIAPTKASERATRRRE
jgi:circadian clock protein KaiC